MRQVREWILAALAGLGALACSDAAFGRAGPPEEGRAAASPLSGAEPSKEAVALAVFAALRARDSDALRALRVTREEYETLLWPELPDRNQMPFEFAWSLGDAGSRKGLRQALERWGGLDLELVAFEFTGEPEVYVGFTLHRGAKVVARRADTGETGVIPTFDVLVEYAGGWKLMDLDEL